MNNLKLFKNILVLYSEELKDLFGDNFSINIEENIITIISENKETYNVLFNSNNYECQFVKNNANTSEIITLYGRNNNGIVTVDEDRYIKLSNKVLVDKINRYYGKSRLDRSRDTLLDIYNNSYVIDGNVDSDKLKNTEYLEECSITKLSFSAHMKHFVKIPEQARSFKDSIYPSNIYLNNQNISKVYCFVDGINKISKVFDIYCGNINAKNFEDLRCIISGFDDKEGFGLKYKKLFDDDELKLYEKQSKLFTIDFELAQRLIDEKVGTLKNFDSNSLCSLIELLNYELSGSEKAKLVIEKMLGIPYLQFEKLDFVEQQKLIRQYYKEHPRKDEHTILVVVGSNDAVSFERVKKGTKVLTSNGYYIAGETLEETETRFNKKIDEISSDNRTSDFKLFGKTMDRKNNPNSKKIKKLINKIFKK